jgi:hypothetical protein
MNILKLAAFLACGCGITNTADAAIMITITQAGNDVKMAASGSFDRSLSNVNAHTDLAPSLAIQTGLSDSEHPARYMLTP